MSLSVIVLDCRRVHNHDPVFCQKTPGCVDVDSDEGAHQGVKDAVDARRHHHLNTTRHSDDDDAESPRSRWFQALISDISAEVINARPPPRRRRHTGRQRAERSASSLQWTRRQSRKKPKNTRPGWRPTWCFLALASGNKKEINAARFEQPLSPL